MPDKAFVIGKTYLETRHVLSAQQGVTPLAAGAFWLIYVHPHPARQKQQQQQGRELERE